MASVRATVSLVAWLVSIGFPAAPPVSTVEQPIVVHDRVVSLWHYLPPAPSGSVPGVAELGKLLRRLHQLPSPPFELPSYEPLVAFRRVVSGARCLGADDRAWLLDEAAELLATYTELDSALGHGLVHGDAYPGNVIGTAQRPILIDWDDAAVGPREVDLANVYQGVRFGRDESELEAFAAAYGYELRDWAGMSTLTAIRDLHTLVSFIRRAESGHVTATTELNAPRGFTGSAGPHVRWTAA